MSHCPTCTSEVPADNRFCGECGSDLRAAETPTQTSVFDDGTSNSPAAESGTRSRTAGMGVGRLSTSDTLADARFLPGLMIAERYRIIGLLGKGGMGEVYRADDLTLGQPVALKFLPESLAQDEGRLSRFLNEVKVARQVSHSSVCRVYDIGVFEGQHYLSMEYVDGEDLASLIRRVGRFSDDKAVQMARQICAGLAAAHAKGIIHRDLKPANVMIDGEGRVRITDFGLAGLADAFQGAEIRVGTPAYMSPEQIRGKEVTVRSDIYSLGLLLYELFTGKAAFDAPTLAELSRQQQETLPSHPSTLVPNFEPTIERVILRCLEKDPLHRPESALVVSGALPGGNPLAAALEAGETPSPEMVAAAGEDGGLRPAVALGTLALLLSGIAALVLMSGRSGLLGHFEMNKPPQALIVEHRQLITDLGYDEAPDDSTYGFGMQTDWIQHIRDTRTSVDRWDDIGAVLPSPFSFWYRQSPQPLVALRQSGSASYTNPPPLLAGMIRSRSDTQGRLIEFLAVPAEKSQISDAPAEPDWLPLFAAAGLDLAAMSPQTPEWTPEVECDLRRAWSGVYDAQPEIPILVEAGGFDGKAVYFSVLAPWIEPHRTAGASSQNISQRVGIFATLSIIAMILLGGLFVARRNLKAGRGDRRSAFRMAAYVFFLILGIWTLRAHHVASIGELGMIIDALQSALLAAGIVWIFYLALEPYVRRIWPQTLSSWSRLFTGRYRDPLVGRDLLIGSLAGVAIALVITLSQFAPGWMGRPGPSPITNGIAMLASPKLVLATLLSVQPGAMIAPIGVFLLIFFLRLLTRPFTKRDWPAVGVAFAVMTTIQVLGQQNITPLDVVLSAAIWAIIILIILRLGLLAASFTFIYTNLLLALPLTANFSDWYAGRAWVGLTAAAAVAGYGFHLALAGRRFFRGSLLDES